MTKSLQIRLILLLLSLPLCSALAENIRGRVIDSLSINGDPVSFGIYDFVTISDRRSSEFQTGLELRIDIPYELRSYRNSFALLLYKKIEPFPNTDMFNYVAKRYFMRLLPSRESTYIRVPYTVDNEASTEPFTDVVSTHINSDDLPLILVVSPVIKGIPDDAFKHKLQVSAKEILKNQGAIRFNFPAISPYEVNEKIEVSIDGVPVDRKAKHVMKSGIYPLRATSSHAHPIERSVEIARGKDMVVDLPFDYGPPVITVVVPEGFKAFINGSGIQAESGLYTQEIEPGRHRILYQIGDLRYEGEFTVIGADKLRISLNVDINFSDLRQAGSDFIMKNNQ